MKFGDVFFFNSHILHGTEINKTEETRVSFDFRMLRDGDDRGLKDETFFIRPGQRRAKASTEHATVGIIYIGKHRGFTKLVSQKYQVLLCNRYARENDIAIRVAETELSGFDHLPMLWHMVTDDYSGSVSELIVFSAFLLPEKQTERQSLATECARRQIAIHFVAEDIVATPDAMLERVEAAYRKSEQSLEL